MKGQSHALWLAREYLHGPMIICFSDNLMETDFSFLANEKADGVAWVMPVTDPRRFGVAELNEEGWVRRFIEKPQEMDNNLVVVGCYYLKSAEALLAAIEKQMEENIQLKGEFFLTDAITLMLKEGAKVRVEQVSTWLDTGTIEATLDTNKFLLEKLGNQANGFAGSQVKVIEPSFIHPSARISNSTIGPYASIGADCRIENSEVTESILEAGCEVEAAALSRSLIGRQAKVQGRGDGEILRLNVGDNSWVISW
jgi:glucose-1-phosphate thymidylyltransferase